MQIIYGYVMWYEGNLTNIPTGNFLSRFELQPYIRGMFSKENSKRVPQKLYKVITFLFENMQQWPKLSKPFVPLPGQNIPYKMIK